MVHKNIIVHGRVQGVGFRYSAQHAAQSNGIKGFVKNLPDGTVYIEAEGKIEKLNEFIAWCRKGPSFAYVSDIKIEEGEVKDYKFFDVKY